MLLLIPMFSFSSCFEVAFANGYNRHTGGTHTHLFSNESVEKMADRMGFEVAYEWRFGSDVNDLYRFPEFDSSRVRIFLKRYNNTARKLDRPRLDLSKKMGEMKFEAEVMAELRKDPARCDAFFRQVRSGIDRGVPLCWGVMVFPKSEGGKCEFSLRVITGYQDSPRRIVCSDGTAAGDKTVIPVEEAWTMTLRLFTLNLKN